MSSGIFAARQRAASSVHACGKYSSMSTGTCVERLATVRLTATWQLAVLPAEPVYCRCTPGECLPCLRKPVSSIIETSTLSPRAFNASSAYPTASRRTGTSSHTALEMRFSIRRCDLMIASAVRPRERSRRLVPSTHVGVEVIAQRPLRMEVGTSQGGAIDEVPGLPGLTLDLDAMWAEVDALAVEND
jgi:hypothetical protein